MNTLNQIRYNPKTISIITLLFIPLILPDYLQNIELINSLAILLVGIMFLFLFVISLIKKQFNVYVIASFIFLAWRMFSSYYINNDILDLVNSFRIITLVLLVNITIKYYPRSTLQALSIIFSTYITVNYISLFAFPNGLYSTSGLSKGWFLGIENQHALIIIPGIVIITLSSWYKYSKISLISWIQIILALLTVLKIWSATAIVAVVFVVFSIMLSLRKLVKPIYTFLFLSISYAILWMIMVRLNSLDSFQAIIVDVLNKDLTLSFRTNIWSAIFDDVQNFFWYGYGINTEVKAGIVTYFAAHNMILQTLLDIGIIGLVLFIVCIILPGIKLQLTKKSRISVLLSIGIFGILIGGLAESYRLNYLFLLLTLAHNVDYLIGNYKPNR